LGVLSTIEGEPGPLLLLHPTGPLGTVRSGMMLADVTPALQAEAETLRADLTELRDLRALQVAAGKRLSEGLGAAQNARSALSQAMSDRTELPRRFTEDPDVLKGLLESADTLEAFAAGLALDDTGSASFSEAKGQLDLPVLGRLLLAPGETDARGVTRPGLSLASRPGALVVSPWAATVRYSGPLLDYGNVIILEPGGGYLLVLAGLEQVYGEVGEVVAKGAALGLMGGTGAQDGDFLVPATEGSGAAGTETLYLELRQGADPLNPMEWFAGLAKAGE
jgi:murein hydrolase activator